MNERILAVQRAIEEQQQLIDRKKQLERLSAHPDFKSFIVDFYCGSECVRYTGLSTNPRFTPEQRADSLFNAQASGVFQRFLNVVIMMGEKAEQNMEFLQGELVKAHQPLPPEEQSGNE
jgi:hypothetical protein